MGSPPGRTAASGSPTRAGTKAIGTVGTGAPAAQISAPGVAGAPRFGSPLTCSGDTWSSWAGEQPRRDLLGFDGYRWLRDGAPVGGTPSATYTSNAADVGHRISCEVTVTYPLLMVTTSATSAPALIGAGPGMSRVPAARPKPLRLLRRPRIVGVAQVGRLLTCARTRVRGASVLRFRWRRGSHRIARAATRHYRLRRIDRGSSLRCIVLASGPGGTLTSSSPAVLVRA